MLEKLRYAAVITLHEVKLMTPFGIALRRGFLSEI